MYKDVNDIFDDEKKIFGLKNERISCASWKEMSS